jgi:hypothetical protein
MKAATTTSRRWHIVLNSDGTKANSHPIAIEFSQDDLRKILKGFKIARNYHGYGSADEFEPLVDNWKSFIALLEENIALGADPVAIELPTKYTLPDIHDFSEALNWAACAVGPNAAHGGMYDLKLCYFLEDMYFQLLEIEGKLGLL